MSKFTEALAMALKARKMFIELANGRGTEDKIEQNAAILICENHGWEWHRPKKQKSA
jgi:hypothetical protein